MINILLMKKWQKIAGLIILFLLTLYELLTWANTYVYLKYVVEPTDNDLLIEQSYIYIDGLSFGMWMNCKHSKKCTFYTLRFGCSFAAVNTIKPQLL